MTGDHLESRELKWWARQLWRDHGSGGNGRIWFGGVSQGDGVDGSLYLDIGYIQGK